VLRDRESFQLSSTFLAIDTSVGSWIKDCLKSVDDPDQA